MSQRPSEPVFPAFLPGLILIGGFALILALLMPASPLQVTALVPTVSATTVATALPTSTLPATLPEQTTAYDLTMVSEGQGIFQSVCFACHGPDARGIPGLGKNLVESKFVHGLTDEQLLQFVIKGRDASDPMNTTGVAMPPRGGNPSLTDDQLRAVIAYVRTLSASAADVQAAPTAILNVPTAAPLVATVLPTRIPVTPPAFTAQSAYLWSCAGCHGSDGKGNDVFGPAFTASPLLMDRAALLAFLTDGKPLADPRTSFPHPPRGGYPALTDAQLSALTDYVLTLVGNNAKP